jgi:3'(2'), 5'-bisphosphate nucleotidase
MLDLQDVETAFAVRVVREAMRLASQVQSGMALRGLTKSDLSPVTVADFGVQALIARALREAFPEAVLVGEESARDLEAPEVRPMLELVVEFVGRFAPGATAASVCQWIDEGLGEPGARFWTLDPIDGTKGYLRGGQYAIALALVENGEVQLGVLGCPNLGEHAQPDIGLGALVVARRGQGAWLHVSGDPADQYERLMVSPCADPVQARLFRSVEASHTNPGQIEEIEQVLGAAAEPVCMDSQAKYAALAAGQGELLLRLLSPKQPDYRERIWDQAAGSLVLEEAGGRITDLRGRPLDFSQGRTLASNEGIFASNGILHEAGLKAIAQVCGWA